MKCYECGKKLTSNYYRCYYAGDDDSNIVCGSGDCWANWIQVNMEELEVDNESRV